MEEILDEEVPDEILEIKLTLPFSYHYLTSLNPNQILITVSASDIISNIPVWERQRIIQDSHVKDIINYQEEYFEKNNKFNFIGVFYICGINDKEYRIIDGQHRLVAIHNLMKKYQDEDFTLPVWIINVDSELERIKVFQNINLSRPISLSDLAQDEEADIINRTAEYIYKKYKGFFSETSLSKPRRPNLKLDHFKNELMERGIIQILNIRTHKELIMMILDVNTYYSNLDESNFPKGNTGNNQKLLNLIAKKGGFYLGMFPDYSWINRMIEHEKAKIQKNNKIDAPINVGNAEFKEDIGIVAYKNKEEEDPQFHVEFDLEEQTQIPQENKEPKDKKKQKDSEPTKKFVLGD